jgi:hypothetical protein
MQNSKNVGLDGFTVEFFKHFYDSIKDDLLLTIRESHKVGKFHGSINSNFLCLVPKKQDVVSFGDYRPIFCYNAIYKIISKIIS